MTDFVSDPRYLLISRMVLSYLEFKTLIVASQVSQNWHYFIAGERSLWLRQFKIHRMKNKSDFNQNISDLCVEDWKELFDKFEEMATFDEILELNRFQEIKVANPHRKRWQQLMVDSKKIISPEATLCKFGFLNLFKAYLRIYNVDINKAPYVGYNSMLELAVFNRRYLSLSFVHSALGMTCEEFDDEFIIVKYILRLTKEKNPIIWDKGITLLQHLIQDGDLEMTKLMLPYVPPDSDFWRQPIISDAIRGGSDA